MGRTSDAKPRLLAAAGELFQDKGYHAVGIQEICDAAGVNKGSFYYFFPSKRDLVLAAIDAQVEIYQQELMQPAFSSDVPVAEQFRQFFHLMYLARRNLASCTGCFFGNLTLELSTHDELVRGKLQSIFEGWTLGFERVLQAAVEAGALPKLDTRRTAQALVALFEGSALLAKAYNDVSILDDLSQVAVNLVNQTSSTI
ncbi:MAG: TetR/AcrR family transcriptional regulator [Deinococcota bacterium]